MNRLFRTLRDWSITPLTPTPFPHASGGKGESVLSSLAPLAWERDLGRGATKMNRLFRTLRGFADRHQAEREQQVEAIPALPGFENRLEVLCTYAERASGYEDELLTTYDEVMDTMMQLQELMEQAIERGQDRDALEYLRMAARLRPQRDLLDHELNSFRAVAAELTRRVRVLVEHIDEARSFAESADLSPAATYYLDQTMTKLTRHFVMLERVTIARHQDLPQRLAAKINTVVDDRQLDLELATYILSRRRALGSGKMSRKPANEQYKKRP